MKDLHSFSSPHSDSASQVPDAADRLNPGSRLPEGEGENRSPLKDRLRSLQRQTGIVPASKLPPPSIAERLARHGRRSQSVDPAALAEQAGGRLIAPALIEVVRRFPLDDHHGHMALKRIVETPQALPEANDIDPHRLVFLDTETTGLSGGSGTAVFMLGLARLEADALVVRQFTMTAFSGEAALLEAGEEWLKDSEGIVSFNGKSFDLPLLVTRNRMHGRRACYDDLFHLDLLHTTRRAFSTRWDDCRLQTAERRLLNFHRNNDLPGSEAPAAWLCYLHSGNGNDLLRVVEHNIWDLVSLATLLPALNGVYEEPHICGADAVALARAWLKQGQERKAVTLLESTGAALSANGRLLLANLYRRNGAWSEARTLWEPLAARGSREAIESLAKYHEHITGELEQALEFASLLPFGVARQQRVTRLRARLERHGLLDI